MQYLVISIFLFCTLRIQDVELQLKPPHYPVWGAWLQCINNQHLTKMTSEIYRDAYMKMEIIKSDSARYEGKSMFAIGAIAANMYHLFDRMIKIYQDLSNINRIKNAEFEDSHGFGDTLRGFGECQSLYHRIRLEKKLFEDVLKQQAAEYYKKQNELTAMYGALPPGGPPRPEYHKGGMYVDRRHNVDDLFDDDDFDSNFEIPLLSALNKKGKKENVTYKINVDQKSGAKNSKRGHKMFAPPPPYARTGHINLEKSDNTLMFKMAKVQKMPPNLPVLNSDSSILKLMNELNKDNPELNPNLGHRRYIQSDGDKPLKSSMLGSGRNPVMSRRMGSDLKTQPPKVKSQAIQSRTKEFDSYDFQPRKTKSNSYPVLLGKNESDSFLIPSRRIELDSYLFQSQKKKSDGYLVLSGEKESDRYSVQSRRKKPDSYPVLSRDKESDRYSVQSRRKDSDSYLFQLQNKKFDRYQFQALKKEFDNFAFQPRKNISNSYPVQSWNESDSIILPPKSGWRSRNDHSFDKYHAEQSIPSDINGEFMPMSYDVYHKMQQQNSRIDKNRVRRSQKKPTRSPTTSTTKLNPDSEEIYPNIPLRLHPEDAAEVDRIAMEARLSFLERKRNKKNRGKLWRPSNK